MKEDEIRKLIKIVEESNIRELEISRWGKTIRITKAPMNSHVSSNVASTPVHPTTTNQNDPTVQTVHTEKESETVEPKLVVESQNTAEIRSPMVGTFYRAPAPEADPYVDVNDMVTKGQVLCIIEAMKLMNEIESEYDGRIVEVLVENAQPVEYNQPLFRVEVT
ncbi:MAG: acetyl-CoA carboxylase biotin carboxyl carrier protein [bacterium]